MLGVIRKTSHTTEKRPMIYIAVYKEAYNRHDISNVVVVLSQQNVAKGPPKPEMCGALNLDLQTRYDRNPVQQ